ncbi:putative inner membrane protein [Anatilimnocola aggregata]|uniref:Putative inner membrane protein n=1 Tax=Anatilimnocola aggregata TaxID=2528021 RepID=A0A517YIW0_9BACT|nr:AI-2E family transporter [Anatilimnocola aggregata]QDU30167.1 putative inner membrane protein [Anatilimnocola aggregata]
MARLVSFVVLLVILILIALLFFRVMESFLLPVFLAALLGVVFQPLYRWTVAHCRNQRYVAATLTTLMVLITVLAPAALVLTLAGAQGLSLATQLQGTDVRKKLDELRSEYSLDIPIRDDLQGIDFKLKAWRDQLRNGETPKYSEVSVENLITRVERIEAWRKQAIEAGVHANPIPLLAQLEILRKVESESPQGDDALLAAVAEFRIYKRDLLGGAFLSVVKEVVNPTDEQIEKLFGPSFAIGSKLYSYGGETLIILGKLLIGTIIIIATLFFLFAEGSRMLDAAIRLSPLEERYVRELVSEFDRVCRAVVAATLLSAVAQGILAGIGFYFAGLEHSVALLMLLTMVLAMVPFTGAASVWVPVCVYLYMYKGDTTAAVGLAVYGTLIISGADNLIKPLVLHGQSNLHPLLALLSVIGGLQQLGPIGILVGPMVVVFLQTLLKILQRELMTMDRLAAAAAAIGVQLPLGQRAPPTSAVPAATETVVDPTTGLPVDAKPMDSTYGENPPASGNGSHQPSPPAVQSPPTNPNLKRKKKR